MFGIEIFVHAVRMVVNDLGTALRISALPMALVLVAAWVFAGGRMVMNEDVGALMRSGQVSGLGAFVLFIVGIVTSLRIAVAWHRFILREEAPTGFVPPFNGGAIGSYLVAGLIFALILILVAIPVSLLAGLVLFPFAAGGGGRPGLFGAVLFGLVLYLPVAYVAYRISPILPSAALQQRMPLKDAWYATATSGAAFVVLTVVSVLAALIALAPANLLGAFLGGIWLFVVQWATILVGASILTTIYGHYVEGRALNG